MVFINSIIEDWIRVEVTTQLHHSHYDSFVEHGHPWEVRSIYLFFCAETFFLFFYFLVGNYRYEDCLTLEVRPVVSILTKYKKSGLGGESNTTKSFLKKKKNTTKSSVMVPPHLASASVHRLPSLYAWTTWTRRNLLN